MTTPLSASASYIGFLPPIPGVMIRAYARRGNLPVRRDFLKPAARCLFPDRRFIYTPEYPPILRCDALGDPQPTVLPNAMDIYGCGRCDICIANRRIANLRGRIRHRRKLIFTEISKSKRMPWLDTGTLSFPMERIRLADRGDSASLAVLERGDDAIAKHANIGMIKRLRRSGAKVAFATAWERHPGERLNQGGTGENTGKLHLHQFLHGTFTWAQVAAAKISWPAGRRPPTRRSDEAESTYWNRVVWGTNPDTGYGWDRGANGKLLSRARREHAVQGRRPAAWAPVLAGEIPWAPRHGLACGAQRWRLLVDDDSDAARAERRKLPAQTGNTNCQLVKTDQTGRLADYVTKDVRRAVQYSTEDGGSFSHSRGYGTETPVPADNERATVLPTGGQRPGLQDDDTAPAAASSGVAALFFLQEIGAQERPESPDQHKTGPPITNPHTLPGLTTQQPSCSTLSDGKTGSGGSTSGSPVTGPSETPSWRRPELPPVGHTATTWRCWKRVAKRLRAYDDADRCT